MTRAWLMAVLVPAAVAALVAALVPRRAEGVPRGTVGSCARRQVVQAGAGTIGTTPGRPNVRDTTPRGESKPAPEPAEEPAKKSRPAEPETPAPAAREPEPEAPRQRPRLDDQELSRGGLPLRQAGQAPAEMSQSMPATNSFALPTNSVTFQVPLQVHFRGGCHR